MQQMATLGRLLISEKRSRNGFGEWLQMQERNFYSDRIFKLVPRWANYINELEKYVEKQRYFSAIKVLHLML
jgi:hypothetical protein